MKIRDVILVVLIINLIISTGILIFFATNGIKDVKNITSEASSGELFGTASKNLEAIAVSICDSLDSQMRGQYKMVELWAKDPGIINAAKMAKDYSTAELYEMWSAQKTRQYTSGGEAIGDGNPDNDLSPAVSKYLTTLSRNTNFVEISVMDSRGYVIAASGKTDDFDQGPDDWTIFYENGAKVLKKDDVSEKGENWFRATAEAPDGFYVSSITVIPGVHGWALEMGCQIKDPDTLEYLGQIRAVFDYSAFVDKFVDVSRLDVYEIKIINVDGAVVATSLLDKSKVNNPDVNLVKEFVFVNAISLGYGNVSVPYTDENGQSVCLGFAVSKDANKPIVMATKKAEDIAAPINKFVNGLQSAIGDKGSTLQRNMIIIGVIVIVLLAIEAIIIVRIKISNPLKKLTAISDKLAAGEIEGLVIDVHGKDEISSFGEHFKGVLAAFNFLKDEAESKK